MLECLVNGEIRGRVRADDRGLAYGDGVFETLVVERGVPRWWQSHMERLAAGCERLDLPMTPQAVLLREVQTACAGQARCIAKVVITRGAGARGYGPPPEVASTRIVSAHPMPAWEAPPQGARLRICDLRLAIQPALGGIKHLNRLEQVLARAEWDDPGIHEGLLLDREDHLVCATAANLFLVSGGRLLTPRLDRCGVRGVLRAEVLRAFRERCEQRRLTLDMLPEADEVIVVSVVRGIVPVTRVADWHYELGPVGQELREWHEQTVTGQ